MAQSAAPAAAAGSVPEQHTVTVNTSCRDKLKEQEATYAPTHMVINDVFVSLCKTEKAATDKALKEHPDDAVGIEVRSECQRLACWGLARLHRTSNTLAWREASLFLTHLEEASFHLMMALEHDSTFCDTNR